MFVSYKRFKADKYRALVEKYNFAADALQQNGLYQVAKNYRNIAIYYSNELRKVTTSPLTSRQMKKRDKEHGIVWERNYADSIELFR